VAERGLGPVLEFAKRLFSRKRARARNTSDNDARSRLRFRARARAQARARVREGRIQGRALDPKGVVILYEGLTDTDLLELSARRLGRSAGPSGAWLGRFPDDGQALFPETAVSAHP